MQCVQPMKTEPINIVRSPIGAVDVHIFLVPYGGLFKRLITTAKYGSYTQIFKDLVSGLVSKESLVALRQQIGEIENIAIVPVPMHRHKRHMRGYNQAEVIAQCLSKYTKIPLRADLVIKTKDTVPQASLSRSQRQKNIHGAFHLAGVSCPENIILVDDVWTTGATMGEISLLLKENGCQRIIAYTLARKWYTSPT